MNRESGKERALLVYAHRKRSRGPAAVLHVAEVMDELNDLVRAAGADILASRVQSGDSEKPATVVGEGTLVRLEEDRRRIRAQIRRLERELDTVRRTRSLHYQRRREIGFPVVALVGYTNAGKSTLFNRLTGADVFVADQLFATLDPTARKFRLPGGGDWILVDTVGFIHDLPAELRRAFLATLEGIGEPDLLLHVADGSSDAMESNLASVDAILAELSFREKPILLVMNKRDLCLAGP